MAEKDDFCQRVLRKRFPGVPVFDDVREVTAESVAALRGNSQRPLMAIGGFPCQGVSSAGMGLGLKDARSALWFDMLRVITELRPEICLIENVDKLLSKGLTTVLHGLDSIGFAAEWDIIPAAAVGAPHLRQRIWIIARPRELAGGEVYGEPTGRLLTLLDKMPRAGRMIDGVVEELVPLAPKKTKRKDGWSYWTGVRLFGGDGKALWPTTHGMCATERRRTGPSGNELGSRVGQVDNGTMDDPRPLLLTPRGTDGDRGGRGDLIQVVRGNPSPSGHFSSGMWPTPDASESGRGAHGPHASVGRFHHTGTKAQRTLTAAAAVDDGLLVDPQLLWATPNTHPRTHTPRQVDHGAQLANVAEVEYALLPTPTPTPTSHLNGNSPENHMRKKAERCGGERGSITDLSVLAANDFVQVSGMMWPTATARDWKDVGDLSLVEENGLLPRVVDSVDRGVRLMPTPTPTPTTADGAGGPGCSGREGGDNLRTMVASCALEKRGSMSATWVEWIMNCPLWWTDLSVPNDFTTLVGWEREPLDVAPRLVVGEQDRAKRLKSLGNAVVWPCAYYALKRALEATPGFGR